MGITEEIEDRVIQRISSYDSNIERVEILNLSARDMLPCDVSWIGASVLSKLDSIEVTNYLIFFVYFFLNFVMILGIMDN